MHRALGGAGVQLGHGQGGDGAGAGGATVRQRGPGLCRAAGGRRRPGWRFLLASPGTCGRCARAAGRSRCGTTSRSLHRHGRPLRRRGGDVAPFRDARGTEKRRRGDGQRPRPGPREASLSAPGPTLSRSPCGPWPPTTRRRRSCGARPRAPAGRGGAGAPAGGARSTATAAPPALDDYYWASNSNLMEKVHLLMMAAPAGGPSRAGLIDAARDQWHWILGRNPNGYSMVTGVGKGPDRIYHMEWGRASRRRPGSSSTAPTARMRLGWRRARRPRRCSGTIPIAAAIGTAPAQPVALATERSVGRRVRSRGAAGSEGWWAVVEPDILYSANFVLAGATLL